MPPRPLARCTNHMFATRFLTELKGTTTKRQEDFMCVPSRHAKQAELPLPATVC